MLSRQKAGPGDSQWQLNTLCVLVHKMARLTLLTIGPPRLCAINIIGRLTVCVASVSTNSYVLVESVEFIHLLMISFPTSHRPVARILVAGEFSRWSFLQWSNYTPKKVLGCWVYHLATDHRASLPHWLPSMNFRGGHSVHEQR